MWKSQISSLKQLIGKSAMFSHRMFIELNTAIFTVAYMCSMLVKFTVVILRLRKQKVVYVFGPGDKPGFGHLISQIHVFNNEYSGRYPVIILSERKGTYSRLATNLHANECFFITRGKLLSILRLNRLDLRISRDDQELFFSIEKKVIRVITYCVKFWDINIVSFSDLVKLTQTIKNSALGDRTVLRSFYLSEKLRIDENSVTCRRMKDFEYKLSEKLLRDVAQNEICSIYFRSKGDPKKEEGMRSGGSLRPWLKSIRFLNDCGYSVLIYGDEIDQTEHEMIASNGAHSAHTLGFKRDFWNLYTPLVSSFTIGNAGGGLMIPVLFGKKICVIDCFGFWFAVPNALHSYQRLIDLHGSVISSQKYFEEDPFAIDELKPYLKRMTEDEILTTVIEFLEIFMHKNVELSPPQLNYHPTSWLNFAPGALISPSYIKQNIL